jgi:RNA polymerase sigma-70 factor (ECF subfamily)
MYWYAFSKTSEYRKEAPFKSWLFGIATHVCLDHLRKKKPWRVEAQLIGEREAKANPESVGKLAEVVRQAEFSFEIREHIAFCFSCIGRTLPPEEQAAITLKEVLGSTNQEAAGILGVSEPVFRHRLAAAREKMIEDYEGLCALINKNGVCYQCRWLREFAGGHRGPDLVSDRGCATASVSILKTYSTRAWPSFATPTSNAGARSPCTTCSTQACLSGRKRGSSYSSKGPSGLRCEAMCSVP